MKQERVVAGLEATRVRGTGAGRLSIWLSPISGTHFIKENETAWLNYDRHVPACLLKWFY